jgi:iron complex transport system substrate-binding protein
VDGQQLSALRPDLVLTQSQCEVCAVSLPEVEATLAQCVGRRPRVLSLAPMNFADLWDNIRGVARAMQIEDAGKILCRRLKARGLDALDQNYSRA